MHVSRPNSSETSPAPDRGTRLVGWKEIAAYLGKTDRTVKRWGRDRGLPVHRVPGIAKTSVYAYSSELDRWLQNADAEAANQPEEAAQPLSAPYSTSDPIPNPILDPTPKPTPDPIPNPWESPISVLSATRPRPFLRPKWLLAAL